LLRIFCQNQTENSCVRYAQDGEKRQTLWPNIFTAIFSGLHFQCCLNPVYCVHDYCRGGDHCPTYS